MKTYLIVDAHNLFWRSSHQKSLAELKTSDDRPSGHFFGLFSMFYALKKKFPFTDLIIAWDYSPVRKRLLFPEYKAQRVREETDGPNIIEEGEKFFNHFKASHISLIDEECDDVIASFVHRLPAFGSACYISSNDKDLWQLIPKANVIGKGNAIVTHNEITKAFSLPDPAVIPVYKAIYGDPSDNIPKVPITLRWKKLEDALAGSKGSLEKFWQLNIIPELEQHRPLIECNYDLAKLRTDLAYDDFKTEADPEGLIKLCKQYECNSLIPKVEDILK